MATILEFRATKHDAVRKDVQTGEALGEIIIFPGVRIERYGIAEDVRPVHPSSGEHSPGARTTSRA